VTASGKGVAEVALDVPADAPGGVVSCAAVVGDDFPTNLQHLQTDPIATRCWRDQPRLVQGETAGG
jgi:hypothetical protein